MTPPPHRSLVTALGILGTHNLVQNSVLNEKGYVTGNLVVSAALVAIGRQSGATWKEMGFGPNRPGYSLKSGVTAAAVAAAVAAIAMTHPRARDLLGDARKVGEGSHDILRRVLVRFPIGTALFEEVAFRGVLPALIDHATWRADALSAGVFAVWHFIPTARVQAASPSARDRTEHRKVADVLAGAVAAGIAGLGLSWLRRRTGSLLAPWLVHASVNSTAFLAGAAAQRQSTSN